MTNAENLGSVVLRLDRLIKAMLRDIDDAVLAKEERELIATVKKALREIRLDVRDYEYAMTRAEQVKWAKIARHNLVALNATVLRFGGHIGPADTAELSALIDTVKDGLA